VTRTKQREKKEHTGNPGLALVMNAFIQTVERLERLVDQENGALRENRLAALEDFNQKKAKHSLNCIARQARSVNFILIVSAMTIDLCSPDYAKNSKTIYTCFRPIWTRWQPSLQQ
jgi:hypothetical protein